MLARGSSKGFVLADPIFQINMMIVFILKEKFMEQKYGALRLVATIHTIFGWIVGIVGCIFALLTMLGGGGSGFGMLGVPVLIGFLFIALFLIAMGQLINVFIDIEHNTRKFSLNFSASAKHTEETEDLNPAHAGIEKTEDEWKCPKCWHSNPLPIGKCGYCSYGS